MNECDQSTMVSQFKTAFWTDIETVGQENRSKRERIYELLLKGMSEEQWYRMIGRLLDDVLTPVVEEKMSLDEHGVPPLPVTAVLEDTCLLYTSPSPRDA